METEEIIKEAIENARRDRKRLEEISDLMLKVAQVGEDIDPLAKAAMGEQMAKITDSLTRSNSQLVELAKLGVKQKVLEGKEEGDTEADREDMFDEIEGVQEG